MATKEEITVTEYARNKNIPRKEYLKYLKIFEIKGGANSVLSKKDQKTIEEFHLFKSNALKYAEDKVAKEDDDIKGIYKIIELCLELLPEKYRIPINGTIDFKVCIENVRSYLKDKYYTNSLNEYITKTKGYDYSGFNYDNKYFSTKIEFPKLIINECNCKSIEKYDYRYNYSSYHNYRRKQLINLINQRKKDKCYSTALIEIIYTIVNLYYFFDKENISNDSKFDFRFFSFVGELFIDMGAIDSALKLDAIDESIFSQPSTLSLLANNAVKIGNLASSTKLIAKLIAQEPYHPSIPILQAEIKRLEQRDRLKSTLSIDFSQIEELSGIEFEYLLMDKFIALGFKVESTPKTGDFGADLIAENSEGSRIIVQCKRFKSKVNLKAVQEVVGAMGHYAGDMGVVITNNSFLNSAVKLAESHDIELWDGDKLVSFLAGDLSFSEIINQ